jgi:hypothetical protein
VEYASHSTCIALPEAHLSFYESNGNYQKMAQEVINMPHLKQYKSSVKRILHFMSQMTLESGTSVEPALHLKGQSYENVCEIITLNDRLDQN